MAAASAAVVANGFRERRAGRPRRQVGDVAMEMIRTVTNMMSTAASAAASQVRRRASPLNSQGLLTCSGDRSMTSRSRRRRSSCKLSEAQPAIADAEDRQRRAARASSIRAGSRRFRLAALASIAGAQSGRVGSSVGVRSLPSDVENREPPSRRSGLHGLLGESPVTGMGRSHGIPVSNRRRRDRYGWSLQSVSGEVADRSATNPQRLPAKRRREGEDPIRQLTVDIFWHRLHFAARPKASNPRCPPARRATARIDVESEGAYPAAGRVQAPAH